MEAGECNPDCGQAGCLSGILYRIFGAVLL
jgi:hypothetical protein